MKISIVIPTWEQNGFGSGYLNELLNTIKSQTFNDFNVIISDHSLNDDIKNMLSSYSDSLEINYYRYDEKRGNSPANTNNGLRKANGDIIKIMFQDDLFCNVKSLETIVENFKSDDCQWLVNGCNHTSDGKHFTNTMVPSWNDGILYGNNTISSPSVLSFRNNDVEMFDEELVMLMDCEYYYRLSTKHGRSTIINDTLITNRMHENQISSMYNKSMDEEINYVSKKYKN